MYVVVCYDVPSDRRRARLAKRLRERIVRVQRSVFQGELNDGRYAELKRAVEDEIDPEEDNVRIYRLCRRCIVGVECLGTAFDVDDEDDVVL